MRSRPPLAACLLVGALLLPLGGCGLFDDDPAPTPTPEVATTSTTSPATPVLDAGAEPRTDLRLRLTEGATTTVVLSFDLDIDQRSGGRTQALDNPPVNETVRFTVDRVEGGRADVSFTFVDVAIDPAGSGLTDAEHLTITDQVRQLIGIGGTGTLSERGRFSDFAYDLPDQLDPGVAATLRQAQDQFATLAVPLPSVPVGVGARWQAETTATVSGIEVQQTTTYEITAIDGDTITYEANTTQRADAQAIDRRSLPPGTTARLVSSELTGTTTGTIDLTSVVAASRYRATGTQVIEVERGGGEPERLTQKVTAAIGVRPVD